MRSPAVHALLCAALLVCGAVSSHAAIQENTNTPFVSVDSVPCANGGAGEIIRFSGVQHTVITYTVSNSKATGLYMTSLQHGVGYGETTGDQYVATGKIGSVLSINLTDGSGSQTLQNTVHFIGKGAAPNMAIHENLRIVINPDGTATVYIDNVNITCK